MTASVASRRSFYRQWSCQEAWKGFLPRFGNNPSILAASETPGNDHKTYLKNFGFIVTYQKYIIGKQITMVVCYCYRQNRTLLIQRITTVEKKEKE